jgi:hypothetical protein
MRRGKIPYLKLDTEEDVPTIQDEMRGQLRVSPWTSGEEDRLFLAAKKSDGTIAWVSLSGVTVQLNDSTLDNAITTIDFDEWFTGSESPDYEANVTLAAPLTFTLGPFYAPDIATGSATTAMTIGFFDTATTVATGAVNSATMNSAGQVLGAILNVRNGRTGGTMTLKVAVNGITTDFGGDDVSLGATFTLRRSKFLKPTSAQAVSFAADDRIGIDLVTSGWSPATDVTAWLIVAVTP